jgi:FkbM family methyltransferase
MKYREDEAFLRSHIKPGESVIDVGANVGFVALAAAALTGPTGSVLAFEAHPATFRYLKQNVRLNRFRNVRLVWAAVGNAAGYVHFSSKANDDVNLVSEKGIRVPVVRIDDVVDEQGQIALLKVDVEGYEKFVFEGARLTLKRVRSIYSLGVRYAFRNFWIHYVRSSRDSAGLWLPVLSDSS